MDEIKIGKKLLIWFIVVMIIVSGDAVFGFTPEEIYIEHNMKYVVSTVPLSFTKPVNRLTVINVETQKQLKEMMDKINAQK